jgi:hypothetical protein
MMPIICENNPFSIHPSRRCHGARLVSFLLPHFYSYMASHVPTPLAMETQAMNEEFFLSASAGLHLVVEPWKRINKNAAAVSLP